MAGERFSVTLTAEEYLIIRTLREMPESQARTRVLRLMDELVEFARNPRCPELQADGAPCAQAHGDCDTCQVVARMIDVLARQIPGAGKVGGDS
jgi:hypothetical protein